MALQGREIQGSGIEGLNGKLAQINRLAAITSDERRNARDYNAAMEDTAGETFAFGKYMDGLVEQLRLLTPRAMRDWDPEAIHDARVATRRLKAAMELCKPLIDKDHRKQFAKVGRKLRRRLGPLRDLDVMIEHLQELAGDEKQTEATGWLIARLEEIRQETRLEVADAKTISKWLGQLGVWWGIRHELDETQEAIDSLLAESLHMQMELFALQAGRLCGTIPMPDGQATLQDPHELRITGKILRYTLEMAAVQGHPLPEGIQKAFKKMQESLGLWHDYVVLTERAMTTSLQALLPHHDAALQAKVLDLTRLTLRKSEQKLERFKKDWLAEGTTLATALRQAFPLTYAVKTAEESVETTEAVDDTRDMVESTEQMIQTPEDHPADDDREIQQG